MKTNHQRNFVEKITAYVGQGRNGGGFDATCGKHGIAQNNRGIKKFYNSRVRFKTHLLERILLIRDIEVVSIAARGRKIYSDTVV
jgi:hypothetical protein